MSRTGKVELISKVSEKANLPKKDVEQAVDSFIQVIHEQLDAGNQVLIKGLGVFRPVEKPATEKRNPQTGGIVKVPSRIVTRFRPSASIKVLKVLD